MGLNGLPVENYAIKAEDVAGIAKLAKENKARLVIVGPEAPLCAGLVDRLDGAGIRAFGPRAKAAIEGSKARQKLMMKKHGIPTAAFGIFDNFAGAAGFVENHDYPLVAKADGLCGGKGVEICQTRGDALEALKKFMYDGIHGEAGKTVVIEDLLKGGHAKEISVLVFCDGTGDHVILPVTQDHKPVRNNNEGPNTGGMGAWGPVFWAGKLVEQINNKIIVPMLEAIAAEGTPFQGCLYAGLMVTDEGPKVIEWNVRPGDPEWQVVEDLLPDDFDLLALCEACATGNLLNQNPAMSFRPGYSVCTVMAAEGYPGKVTKGDEVTGIDLASILPGVKVIQAGTVLDGRRILTASGRVINVITHDEQLDMAIRRANTVAEIIKFRGKHYRTDIGAAGLKVIEDNI